MLLLLIACVQEGGDAPTGAELLDGHSAAYCDVLVQSDCGIELAACGAPAMVFNDKDACLDARENAAATCEGVEQSFLGNAETVQVCTDLLSNAASACAEEDICPGGASIFAEGPCSDVQALFEDCP